MIKSDSKGEIATMLKPSPKKIAGNADVVDAWNSCAPRRWSSELLVRLSSSSTTNFFSSHPPSFLTTSFAMSLLAINTVDRLDRPSAYYIGKVRHLRITVSPSLRNRRVLMAMRRISDADITTVMMRSQEKRIPQTSCVVPPRSMWAICMFCLQTGNGANH